MPVGDYGSQTGQQLLLHHEWHPFWEPPTGEPRFVIARVNPIDDEYFAEWWRKGRLMLLWFDGTRIIEPLLPNMHNLNNGNDFRQGRDDTSTAISIWCEVQDHDQTREMVGAAEYIATMLSDMPTAPLPSFPEELAKYWPQDRTCGVHDVVLGEQAIANSSITFMDTIGEECQIVVPYSLAEGCLMTICRRQAWREKAPGYLQTAGILAVSHMQGMNTKDHSFAHDMCERWEHGIPDGIQIS